MPEEWLEVSYINYDKAILHGFAVTAGKSRSEIEQVLTQEQQDKVVDMNEKHREEMQKLLRSFVSE